MTDIRIIEKNNFLYLYGIGLPGKELLDEEFSYEIIEEHILNNFLKSKPKDEKQKRKQVLLKEWDRKRHFLIEKYDNFKHDYFYKLKSGFLDRLKLTLEINDITFSYTNMNSISKSYINYEWNFKYPLWNHQIRALEECKNNPKGIINIATGGGKTIIIAKLIHDLGLNTNLFVFSRNLLHQHYKDLSEILGKENVGIMGDGKFNLVNTGVNIVSIKTAYNSLRSLGYINKYSIDLDEDLNKIFKFEKFKYSKEEYSNCCSVLLNGDMSIYDEIDVELGIESMNKIDDVLPSKRKYGFTATPYRNDNKGMELEASVGNIIYTKTISDLIKQKILVKPRIIMYSYDYPLHPKALKYKSIYKYQICLNKVRNRIVLEKAKEFQSRDMIGIILVDRIKNHSKKIKDLLDTEDQIIYKEIYGKHNYKTRNKVFSMLREREIDVLLTTIFKRGDNIPEIDFGIRGNGIGVNRTGNPHSSIPQFLGRLLRNPIEKEKREKKNNRAILIDFWDSYLYLKDHSSDRRDYYSSIPEFDFKIIKWRK